ncbi:MAG: exosortase C-terminal domain/associated protein EpsI [Armatimonadota bacterium]
MQGTQIRLVVCIVLALAALVVNRAVGRLTYDKMEVLPVHTFPKQVGEWKFVRELEQDPQVMKHLPSAVVTDRIYERKDGRTVNLTLLSAREYVDFHDPWFCFRGQGFQMSPKQRATLAGQPLDEVVAEKDGYRLRAVYWWKGRAAERPKYAPEQWNRILALKARLQGRQEASLQIRILTVDEPDARGVLEDFIAAAQPELKKLEPKDQ